MTTPPPDGPMLNVFLLASDPAAVRTLAAALPADRFRVTVGILGPVGEQPPGVAVCSLPVRGPFDLTGVRRLRRAVREADPAVVHAWGPGAARAARFVVRGAADGGNTPRLVVSAASDPGGGLGGWLAGRAVRRADRVIPATRADGERYRRLGVPVERFTLIGPAAPPPVEPAEPAAVLRGLDIPAGGRLLVAGGRTDRGLGPKDAIVAFDMLRYDTKDLHLVVFGAGPEAAALEQFGRSLAFDDFRVRFAPPTIDRAAAVALAAAVFVTDPLGVDDALGAMAAAKPVLGWQTPDLAEVVDDGVTGLLVPAGDRAALATRARALLNDPAAVAKMGAAGRTRAAERFGVARVAEQFGRLYAELAGS